MYIHKMTEQNSNDKYIKCARCKKKYLNNDNDIKINFGYNRLKERYKTCIKCRTDNNSKTHCEKCGIELNKSALSRHKKTNLCLRNRVPVPENILEIPDVHVDVKT